MLKICKENNSDHDIEPLNTLACISKKIRTFWDITSINVRNIQTCKNFYEFI